MYWLSLAGLYKIHKWTSIIGGIALLMWLFTAVAMSWDTIFPHTVDKKITQFAYDDFELSPSEALEAVARKTGQVMGAQSIEMKVLANKPVYVVTRADSVTYIVDAADGSLLEITTEFAEQIALAEIPTDSEVQEVELLTSKKIDYAFGQLPVYRIIYDDPRSTHVFVSPLTGEVTLRDRVVRAGVLWGAFHEFYVLRAITDSGPLITVLLWLSTLLVIFTAVLGYYMALPHRRRPRRR